MTLPDTLHIQDEKTLVAYLRKFTLQENRVFDTESTGLSYDDELLGITLYSPGLESVFIFVETDYFEGIPLPRLITLLNPVFKEGKWYGHNIKYDLWVLAINGFVPPAPFADTMALIHVFDPSLRKKMELRVEEDLGYPKKDMKTLTGKKWDNINWLKDTKPQFDKKGVLQPPLITVKLFGDYAAEDGFFTYELYKEYQPKVYEDEDLIRVYEGIEMPLIPVLMDMKVRGVNINPAPLIAMRKQAEEHLDIIRNSVYEEAGVEFNLGSPKQLGEVLFDKLGYPVLKTTPSGGRSTDSETLETLALRGYPLAERLQEYSEVDTLLSSFIRAIPALLDSDGYLRGDLNSFGAETGRFSSSNPNLQNQPNDPRYPVRKAFIASPGNVLLIGDYSQIEPRLMAHISRDERLCEIYHVGGDIYQGIADDLGITRKQAKVLVLALMYGMGPQKMADTLRIPLAQAKGFISAFYRKFRTFARWKAHIEDQTIRTGYVKTLFGRRRLLPHVHREGGWHFRALRQAVNTAIQGSAADLIKIAMVELTNEVKARFSKPPHLVIQVHDELLFDCPAEIALEAKKIIQHKAENLIKFDVPIKMEFKSCHDWSQMKDDSFKGIDDELRTFNLSGLSPMELWLLIN